MELLYLLIAFVTLVYALYSYFTRTFNYWKSRGVVGPEPVPFFGNLKEKALRRKNVAIVFREFYDEFPNEKVVGIYRMTTPCAVLRDLDVIKNVMIKDFDMFVDRGVEFSKEGLGANLFHSDGDTWRVLRNRFTPLFTSGKLKNMLYLMTERGESFVDYVGDVCDLQLDHEVHQLVQKYTMSTISACAFGLDIDTIHDQIDTLKKIDELIFRSNYFEELDMMYPGILKKLNTSLFPAYVKNFFYDLVNKVISERNGIPGNRKDFMDLILEMRQQGEVHGTKRNVDSKQLSVELTDHMITAQAFIFYAAGYETSATTMSFLLYELAKNPDIQEKLHDEIMEVLQRHEGKMTYETLQDMTYLEKVFDETLRLYPIVDPVQRNALVDYKVPGTDIVIEKGTTVFVSIYGIHHDARYYPDPEKFDPERFTTENCRDRNSCAYLPFGVGPRNCIGKFYEVIFFGFSN